MSSAFTKQNRYKLVAALIAVFICVLAVTAYAAERTYYPTVSIFETGEDGGFASDAASGKDTFSYGKKAIGVFSLNGSLDSSSEYQGVEAYSAEGTISVGYSYNGGYQSDDATSWNLNSSGEKSVAGIETKKVKLGTVVVQKSSDGTNWETVKSLTNYFKEHESGRFELYSISESEIKAGTFFRVYVAYEMKREVSEKTWILGSGTYEYINCLEEYTFYVYYGNNPIILRDIVSGADISNSFSTVKGFILDKGGSSDTVSVKSGASYYSDVDSYTSFYKPGIYTITAVDSLGKQYTRTISVTQGLEMMTISPAVYENEKKDEYTEENRVYGNLSFGMPSYSNIKIAQQSGTTVASSTHNGFHAYGITGDSVCLFISLNSDELNKTGYSITSDDWGKKEKQTICGVQTGEVQTGALIIQTSNDGEEWINVDKSRYANGLYSTNFNEYYSGKGDVMIYAPDGDDVLHGLYIRIYYAYETCDAEGKTYHRTLEKYEFYLCSDELNAVTFHNLSVANQVSDLVGADNETTADLYKRAETMLDGAYTVTGFSIDTTLNPTVTYGISLNGRPITHSANGQYTAEGKYSISLKSAAGSTKTVTLYVDRMSSTAAYSFYFGDGFIDGKRIYSEGQYPVFEGGLTSYSLQAVNNNHLPLCGEIQNISTRETITISGNRSVQQGDLLSSGEYVATFSTNPSYATDKASGDNRVFTFHFRVIANGTAPGPQVNQNSLAEYSHTNMVDSYPIYFGVTFGSASKGNITLAFATKEAAVEYAYEYTKGTVEKQSDGSFRYGGKLQSSQKSKYVSAEELTDAMYEYAECAVEVLFFNLADEFTYLTLTDELISETENPRTLELSRSVTIFADAEQKELLTSLDSLPIINDKPHAYLNAGSNGRTVYGMDSFEFVHDKYGCDSESVEITDSNGKVYSIEYNSPVGEQLKRAGCPTGIVTVTEKTVYGDAATYQALYFAEGENTAKLSLTYYSSGKENQLVVDQSSSYGTVYADAFKLDSLVDELDQYSLVLVSNESNEYYYVADQLMKNVWADAGTYQITVINRLGYSFSIDVVVSDSEYAAITFSGEGTESTEDILTYYGAERIQLPELTRYGYDFLGYTDDAGNTYSKEIAEIVFKGTMILDAKWKPKSVSVSLLDSDGNTLLATEAEFGTYFELPTPELAPEQIFDGWTLDGVALTSEEIKIDSENGVILVAHITGDSNEAPSEDERGGSGLLIGFSIVGLFAVVGGLLFSKKKKAELAEQAEPIETVIQENSEKGDDNDDPNA